MSERAILYKYSLQEAVRCNEKPLWRESYAANCKCARAIENSIKTNFDGMSLQPDSAKSVIAEFGFERVMWVLANTIKEKNFDGRFSKENKDWARSFYIPKENKCRDYCVESHPAVVDGFVNQMHKEWQALGLFEAGHCHTENDDEMDYTDRVVVINPHCLKDEYKTPEDQLFLANGGFGCHPNSRGRKVYGEFLKDGERTFYQRADIIGVLKDEYMPDWAKEKLQQKCQQESAQTDGMTMQ